MTDTLTADAARADRILPGDSRLMRAVFDFGGAWLERAGKLTLHDPLAAVAVFHPDICGYERGRVSVETARESSMGATAFTAGSAGHVEVARTAARERFYDILSEALRR